MSNRRIAIWTCTLLFGSAGLLHGTWYNDFLGGVFTLIGLLVGALVSVAATSPRIAFRLRRLMQYATAFSMVCIFAFAAHRHYDKHSAIQEIESHGGKVFDIHMKGWFSVSFNSRSTSIDTVADLTPNLDRLPPFHLTLIGPDYSATAIQSRGGQLSGITHLRSMRLIDTNSDPAALNALKSQLKTRGVYVAVRNTASQKQNAP